jgi:hypothetical protein
LTLAGSAISNLYRPAGASIIDLSPLDGDLTAAAVAQLDLAEMTDDAVILRPSPRAKPAWVLLDYVPHWQPPHLSPSWCLDSTLCAPVTQTAPLPMNERTSAIPTLYRHPERLGIPVWKFSDRGA